MVSRKSASKKKETEEPYKAIRYYYEGGDKNNLSIFRSLHTSAKLILRSLYLEHCTLKAVDLLHSIDGCNSLKTLKLDKVVIEHAFQDREFQLKNYQGIHLPKLSCLYVSDVSNNDLFHQPFADGVSSSSLSRAQEFASYNIDFYSQILCHQLNGEKSLRFLSQSLTSLRVDISIIVAGYKIFLWFQSIPKCEKVIISPLVKSYWTDNLLKNFVDAATIKYMSCSDQILSLESTPCNLDELNLYISKENSSLLIDLAQSKKLSNLSTLILYFEKKLTIDLHILALNISNLDDLIITNAMIQSTATEPIKVSDCCFEQCTFSENFMANVSRFLRCKNFAVDVHQIPNWEQIFKINLMEVSGLTRIISWSIIDDSCTAGSDHDDDKIVFGEECFLGLSGRWEHRPFDNDAKFRRSVLLHLHDFFKENDEWDDQKNLGRFPTQQSINRDQVGSKFEKNSVFLSKILAFIVGGIAIWCFFLFNQK